MNQNFNPTIISVHVEYQLNKLKRKEKERTAWHNETQLRKIE